MTLCKRDVVYVIALLLKTERDMVETLDYLHNVGHKFKIFVLFFDRVA